MSTADDTVPNAAAACRGARVSARCTVSDGACFVVSGSGEVRNVIP